MDRRRFVQTSALAGTAAALGGGLAAQAPTMPYIVFTKKLKARSVEDLIDCLKAIAADGADLTVRPGFPVNPDNCGDALAPAAEKLRAAGLSVPMVTAPTELTNTSRPYTETMFRACGEAGVPLLKLGYWAAPTENYWQAVESMKRDLAGFVELGQKHKVRPCLHTHSGNNLALNAAATMHVLRDFPPERAGAYVDVGHIAVCGEPPPLAFAMAAEWLSIVGMKDLDRIRTDEGGTKTRTVNIGEGFVDWRATVQWLVKHDFRGPLTFHCEFPAGNREELIEQARKDLTYIRGLEAEARGG